MPMKKCSYCGAEYPDDATICAVDHTPFEQPSQPTSPVPPPESKQPGYDFVPLSEQGQRDDLVTLVRCGSLVAADMIATRLRAAGIGAFLPDEFLMQAVGWNFNTFGFVRVQVAPKDYAAARDLIAATDCAASSSTPP